MIITLTTLLAGAVLAAAIAGFFWPQIAWLFRKKLIPWIRKTIGDSVANLIVDIFNYIDNAMCWGRQKIKAAWNWLFKTILKGETTYKEKDSSTYSAETKTYLQDENSNNVKVVTQTRTLSYDELPDDVRHEMNRRNLQKFTVNDREIIADKVKEAAENKENLSPKEIMAMTL